MSQIYFKINGVDKSLYCEEVSITRRITFNPDSASFIMKEPSNIPAPGQEVHIYLDTTATTLFKGMVYSVDQRYMAPGGKWMYVVVCTDWTRLFDRRLIAEEYTANQTVEATIADIVTNYTAGFTVNNVDCAQTLLKPIRFNYRYPSDCLRELSQLLVDYVWWIDEDKDVHFKYREVDQAPKDLDDTALETDVFNFRQQIDTSQVRNRVFIYGGWESNATAFTLMANGESRIFNLRYSPHDLTLTVGGATKVLGQENVDVDDGTYDYFYNYYEKTLFCATAEATPGIGVKLIVSMNYEVPILARVSNTFSQTLLASLEGGDGIYDYVFKDSSLVDTPGAERRGLVELERHAYPHVLGSFSTFTEGFYPGQSLTVNITGNQFNATYTIQTVNINSMGGNSIVQFDIEYEGKYNG